MLICSSFLSNSNRTGLNREKSRLDRSWGGWRSLAHSSSVTRVPRPSSAWAGFLRGTVLFLRAESLFQHQTNESLIGAAPRGPPARARHRKAPVSYTHLRAHETRHDLVCRL